MCIFLPISIYILEVDGGLAGTRQQGWAAVVEGVPLACEPHAALPLMSARA